MMKILYVFTLIVLVFAIIMSLGFNVNVPEPIPEKMALRIMEGCLKGLGIFVSTYKDLSINMYMHMLHVKQSFLKIKKSCFNSNDHLISVKLIFSNH